MHSASFTEQTDVEDAGAHTTALPAASAGAISSAGINITRAQVHSVGDRKAQNTFELMVSSADELNRVIRSLGRVRGVMKVARVRA